MFERPHGRKKEYTLNNEVMKYYETDPGKSNMRNGRIIGKIIKDTGSILGDVYNPSQASFDLPQYHTEVIKGQSSDTKKTSDIYKSLEWIWKSYASN